MNESEDAEIKVIDFGTSRKFDPNKRMTKRLGTVKFIDIKLSLTILHRKFY